MTPHQAARVVDEGRSPLRVVAGEPSLINLLDALNGWALVREAATAAGRPATASFKHVPPAGVAPGGPIDDTMAEAFRVKDDVDALTPAHIRARDADPKSSFGDMVAVSEPVTAPLADLLVRLVSVGIVAPGLHAGDCREGGGEEAGQLPAP